MRYFYTLLLLIMASITHAQQSNYATDLIPKELLSHASAVVRNNETVVEIKGLNDVTCRFKGAITILNKNGDDQARIVVWHDKIRKIRYIKGAMYDSYGKLIGKISESDLDDRNVADGFSLFNDGQVKYYRPSVNTYPYTIEYDYQVANKQSLMLEDWDPYPGRSIGTAIQHSSYKLICKPDVNIRYKEINYPGKVIITEAQGFKTYNWSINDVKAKRYEPFSPDSWDILTSVKVAPEKFNYEGIPGSFTNWNEYGKWIYDKLLKNRQQLPQETVEHIKDITANLTDPKQKAKVIYEYMQQKTRYVSVQIGIGGYQPFLATDVDQQAYGDCKALVNYTQSLLSIAGIESYYVLVMAGPRKQSAFTDLASMNQFDHVILCLPFKNDTTWLECTNKQMPFGFLGDFTDDRNVVACTPDGGKLLHTPVYKAIDNKQTRKATFNLNSDGELSGTMVTTFEGTQYDNRESLINEPRAEQLKTLKEIYPIENLDIQTLDLKQDKNIRPITTETIKLTARDYAAKNGDRFFFTPNTGSRYIERIKDVVNRVNPVYINRGYVDVDEIVYTLPEGYKISSNSINVSLDKPFGKYTASTKIEGDKLIYKRMLQFNDGTYSKDIYADMVDFYESVYGADNYQLTMEKK